MMCYLLLLKLTFAAEIARNFRDFLCGLVSSHACHIECILDALIQVSNSADVSPHESSS